MKILQHRTGASAVVGPQGPIIGADAEQLAAVLAQVIGEGAASLTLDLDRVPFVDSRGLEILMETAEGLIRTGKVLRLAAANETLREVLRLTGLAPLFEFPKTAQAATEAGAK